MSALMDATDIIDAMQCTARLVLAAENIRSISEEIEVELRRLLAETMDSSGAPAISIGTHTISVGRSASRVVVTEPLELPAKYMVARAPALDRDALLSDLKQGPVPGAIMVNNGEPRLIIRSKKQ